MVDSVHYLNFIMHYITESLLNEIEVAIDIGIWNWNISLPVLPSLIFLFTTILTSEQNQTVSYIWNSGLCVLFYNVFHKVPTFVILDTSFCNFCATHIIVL